MADEDFSRKDIVKKLSISAVLIIIIIGQVYLIGFLEDLNQEPEYIEYHFELGDAVVQYNGETIQITIKEGGTYRIMEVYEKTENKEHSSGYYLGEAPLEQRIDGCNISNDYFGYIVYYLKLERIDTGESEYKEVIR